LACVYTADISSAVNDCDEWWEKNCVYLEPEVRKSFVAAYRAAGNHKRLIDVGANAEDIKKSWLLITAPADEIMNAIQLPRFSEIEREAVGVIEKT
jgi:hypothetical protein